MQYASLVARVGAAEMRAGNAEPSPAFDACAFCKLSGSCGFQAGVDGDPREKRSVKCGQVVRIVRRQRGDE